jgi:hypothetical protein
MRNLELFSLYSEYLPQTWFTDSFMDKCIMCYKRYIAKEGSAYSDARTNLCRVFGTYCSFPNTSLSRGPKILNLFVNDGMLAHASADNSALLCIYLGVLGTFTKPDKHPDQFTQSMIEQLSTIIGQARKVSYVH